MGKVTGFHGDRSAGPALQAGLRPHPPFQGIHDPALRGGDAESGGALHELRRSVLHGHGLARARHARLPGEQPDPRLERSRLSRRLARRALQSAFDQQLPGVHRPRVSGAVRSVVRPQPHRDAGHHQINRMRDRGSRLRGRLDRARTALAQDRQEGLGDRLGPGRHGLRAAARARRPRGARVREVRARRRPAHLRHSRLQDGEASRRKARDADGRRRRRLPLRRACRRQHAGRARHRRLRRGGADRRRGSFARPADPGPRALRHSLRDGLSAAAEPPHRGRTRSTRRRSQRRASMWW